MDHSKQHESQAMRQCRELLVGLSEQWSVLDLGELASVRSALLWMATASGLIQCRFQCRAWTDSASVEAEVSVIGLWLDAAGQSVLPGEFRKAIPAWEHKRVGVQLAPVIEVRLTRSGVEAQADLQADEQHAWLTLAYMTTQPKTATVKLRLIGEAICCGRTPGLSEAQMPDPGTADKVEMPELSSLLEAVAALTDEVRSIRQAMRQHAERTAASSPAASGSAPAPGASAGAAGAKPAKRGPDRLPLEEAWRYLAIVQEWDGIQEQNKKRLMRHRYQKIQLAEKRGISVKELNAMLAWYRKNRGAGRFPRDSRTLSKGELEEWFE